MKGKTKNITKILILAIIAFFTASVVTAQENKKNGIFTNRFRDNWEISVGVEHLSFYSGREDGMNISKSPFCGRRSNFGATAMVGKWFTPEIGLRTKFSGYWGKAVSSFNPNEENVRFFAFNEQVMINATNAIMGYNPARKWDVIPYGGVGVVRNVTHGETSIGAGFGVIGTYAINHQMKVHADMGLTFAGSESGEYNGKSMMGKYRYFAIEAGITFNLGKSKWNRQVHRSKGALPITKVGEYSIMQKVDSTKRKVTTEMILAENPVPEGMALVNRGHLKMGVARQDSMWGFRTPVRNISVDDFYMDRTEITNRQYRAFIQDVCDSIIAERMEDPYYEGNINKVKESLYITNPVTGEQLIDTRQLIYCYEEYDFIAANKRKYRLDPKERVLDTDVVVDEEEVVKISKDTAYVDKHGNIVRETIERPLAGPYDFLNTYAVNIYPDTTCWINDFPNADNEMYTRYYFSHPDYQDYPVVGVTWEQANAYCAWRTEQMMRNIPKEDQRYIQKFRLPTEAEWEYAARGATQNEFPWEKDTAGEDKAKFFANFMPDDGDFTKDGNIITAKVGTYIPNSNGLYDMAGNVAEWTSTVYTTAGVEDMNNINPQLRYNAAVEDPYQLKRKCVRGGSWKDSESHILSAWRAAEYQNQPRSYIGFRCVQSIASKPSERTIVVLKKK